MSSYLTKPCHIAAIERSETVICYPLREGDFLFAHSGLVYNLMPDAGYEDYDNYGRLKDSGALCFTELDGAVKGIELWRKRRIPRGVGYGCWHGAIDLMPREGKLVDVLAIASSKVIRRGSCQDEGCYLILRQRDFDAPVYWIYHHLEKTSLIANSEEVVSGQRIGRLAALDEPHLHLEAHSKKILWNPCLIQLDESQDFFYKCALEKSPWSRFKKILRSCGLALPYYTYNAWKLVEHLGGVFLRSLNAYHGS